MRTLRFALLPALCLMLTITASRAQNVLYDGDFSLTTTIEPSFTDPGPINVWAYWQMPEVIAQPVIESQVACYQITFGSDISWAAQIIQQGFSLNLLHNYRLTFDVKAAADRTFGVFLGEVNGNWEDLLGYENYIQQATTEWKTLTFNFKAYTGFPLLKLSFEVGNSNTSICFDNVMLEDLGPYTPDVGIIGTAVNGGWDTDVNMLTTDGIHYMLADVPLMSGRMKFRQDDKWYVNWGNTEFPSGTGMQDGMDIPVPFAGTFDIAFNRVTGEYTFTCKTGCLPYIELSGTAVPPWFDWDHGQNMLTADGISYILPVSYYQDGEALFRESENPANTWGGIGFPAGTAVLGGPAIPVKSGLYDVFFNRNSGEYAFKYLVLGIVGTFTGWDNDIEMQTTDGWFYSLKNQYIPATELKFRVDHNWQYNFGGTSFPHGWSWGNDPNIPVPEGTYDITFDLWSGEYNFVAVTCPNPGIQCPESIWQANDPGMCGAYIYYPDVTAAPNCGGSGVTLTQTQGLPGGSFFPVGTTTNTFVLTNEAGATVTCSFDVTVYDIEAPVITILSQPESLWPPDHRMVPIELNYTATDVCGPVFSEIYIYSSEPDNGLGDGDKSPDYQVTDDHHILLRAERSGKGTGRDYYIIIYSRDASWNYSYQVMVVNVPHDQKITREMAVADATVVAAVESTDKTSEKLFRTEVWPNPSTSGFSLRVQTASEERIHLSVCDISGRLISSMDVPVSEITYFGEKLVPGVYVLKMQQGGWSRVMRVVKE